MRRHVWLNALATAALLAAAGVAPAEGRPGAKEALALQTAVQEAIARAEPAVACVVVSRSDEYPKPQPPGPPGRLGGFDPGSVDDKRLAKRLDLADPDHVPEYYGSGVVIDAAGLVLTNYHVVRDAAKVYVRLPGKRGSYADIHAADPRSDLAVLRLITPPPKLTAVTFGDGGAVRKGDWVIWLANPYSAGFRDGAPVASWGIVGALRRKAPPSSSETSGQRVPLHQQSGTLIQTDARLNAAVSGGALVNLDGELVGLTTSLGALTGVESGGGYAVPLDAHFRRIVEVLRRGEEVEYGFLGVTFADSPDGRGVALKEVTPGSPAAKAGLHPGDVITAINDIPIRDVDDGFLHIGAALAGNEITLTAEQFGGRSRTVKATLAKYLFLVPGIVSVRPEPVHGLRIDYTSIWFQERAAVRGPARFHPQFHSVPSGVYVREVVPDSPADRLLKSAGQIITKVNGRPVHTPAEFYQEARKAKGPIELTLIDPADPGSPRTEKLP